MQYGKIVSTGFLQAWKYKTLWFFGLFVSGAAGTLPNVGTKFDLGRWQGFGVGSLENWYLDNPLLALFLALVVLVLIVVTIILHIISIGGLIDAAGQLKRNEPYRFSAAIKAGVRFFWRLLGLTVLTIVVVLAFVILLILLGVIAFLIHTVFGVLALLILVPVLFVGVFILTITVAMTERQIVSKDRGIFDGISDGFALWTAHWVPSVLYTLMYIGIGIALFIVTALVALPMIAAVIGLFLVNPVAAVFVGVFLFLPVFILIEAYTGAAAHLMTTEFYFQLQEEPLPAPDVIPETVDPYSPPEPPSFPQTP
jgi:hypothetical protein